MNFTGPIIGGIAFLAIGLFHPLVIQAEYHFSKKIWPVFALAGVFLLLASVSTESVMLSAGLAVVGMSALWSIGELFQQEKRVEKGWFPKNPKRDLQKNEKHQGDRL